MQPDFMIPQSFGSRSLYPVAIAVVAVCGLDQSAGAAGVPRDSEPQVVDVSMAPVWRNTTANFRATNQSLVGGGISGLGITEFIGLDWGSKEFTPRLNLGERTLQGFMAGEFHDGRLGLEAIASVTAGDVDIDYAAGVGFKYDNHVTLGEKLKIETRAGAIAGSEMTANGPELNFQLDFVTDYKLTYGLGIDTGLSKTWTTEASDGDNRDKRFDQTDWSNGSLFDRHRDDNTLLSSNGEQRKTLLQFDAGMQAQDFSVADFIEGSVQFPDAMSGRDTIRQGSGMDLSVTMVSDPIVDLDMDLVDLVSKAFPTLKALSGDLDFGLVDIDYTLFNASIAANAKLRQEVKLDVDGINLEITDTTRGVTMSGEAGDTFEFNKPVLYNEGPNAEDEMELDFLAKMTLDHTLTAQTYLDVTADMVLEALAFSADYSVLGNSGELFSVGPVWSPEIDLFDLEILLNERVFEIDDFGEETFGFSLVSNVHHVSGAPALSVVPEPASAVLLMSGLALMACRPRGEDA